MRFSPPASRRKRSSEHWDFSLAVENSLGGLACAIEPSPFTECSGKSGSWRVNPKRHGRVSLKSLDPSQAAGESMLQSRGKNIAARREREVVSRSRSVERKAEMHLKTHFSPIQDSSPTALYR